jgi:hypothetical protein
MTDVDFSKLIRVGKSIIASNYLPLQHKLNELKIVFGFSAEQTDDLESKIDQAGICILGKKEELSLQKIRESKFTPVFYACSKNEKDSIVLNGSEESLEEKTNKFTAENNIYSFIDLELPGKEISSLLINSLSERLELLEKLQNLPTPIRAELLQKNYDANTFRNFLQDVRTIFEEQKFLDDDARLVRLMEDYTNNTNERTEKLAIEQARKILNQYKTGQRHNTRLGAGLSSEPGSTNRLGKTTQGTAYTHALRWRVFRVVENDRTGHKHSEIAEQRYEDAFYLQKYYGFKTPVILKPLDLSKLDSLTENSFILMQEVEGPTLNDVLRKIQTEVHSIEERVSKKDTASIKRMKQLSSLRSALVNKYSKDIALWQNAGLPTFVKKPSGKLLIDEYKQRISTFPEILEVIAPDLFDIAGEGSAYLESRNILDELDATSENIVRVRDASLPNAALQFDKVRYDSSGQAELTMSDIERTLLIPGKENGNSVDLEKINNIFYNLDLHYRYGHIFEDLAHLTTEAECAFLVHGEKGFNVKGVKKLFYDFTELINREDLKKDEKSVYLMLNYRSQRKLILYASSFALNSLDDFEKGNITKQRLDRRLKMFERNIRNHALSCGFLSGRLKSIFASECENKQERSHVAKWYKDAKLAYGTDYANQYLTQVRTLTDPSARAYWHACASELTNEKLVHYLNKKPLYFDRLKNANKTRVL